MPEPYTVTVTDTALVQQIAAQREQHQTTDYKHRPFSEWREGIGAKGEAAFCQAFNQDGQQLLGTGSDGGVDIAFTSHDGKRLTVDVKTALYPKYLIVPVGEVTASLYVLAQARPDNWTVTFYGWATRQQVLAAPVDDGGPTGKFRHGLHNHYILAKDLRSMDGLAALLAEVVHGTKETE